jgi:hypothetical protein
MFNFGFIFVVYSRTNNPYILLVKSIYILICFLALLTVKPAIAMQRDTTYKVGDFLIETSDTMKIDLVIKGEPIKKRVSRGDVIYEDAKYLILGNDDKTAGKEVFRKYKPKYKSYNFSVSVYKGKLASPNFKTDKEAYSFRTRIRTECKRAGINFAGHYTVVKWGCGSPCQEIAIVDRINGKIYYSCLPEINNEIANGFKCKPDSRMLILNSDLLDQYKGYINCSTIAKVETIEWVHNKARRLPE